MLLREKKSLGIIIAPEKRFKQIVENGKAAEALFEKGRSLSNQGVQGESTIQNTQL